MGPDPSTIHWLLPSLRWLELHGYTNRTSMRSMALPHAEGQSRASRKAQTHVYSLDHPVTSSWSMRRGEASTPSLAQRSELLCPLWSWSHWVTRTSCVVWDSPAPLPASVQCEEYRWLCPICYLLCQWSLGRLGGDRMEERKDIKVKPCKSTSPPRTLVARA